MSIPRKSRVLIAALAIGFAEPSLAADDTAVLKDLTAVIALQGLSCGQVVSVVRQGENAYIASCQDGHQYRVFVNSQGRVVVEKQ